VLIPRTQRLAQAGRRDQARSKGGSRLKKKARLVPLGNTRRNKESGRAQEKQGVKNEHTLSADRKPYWRGGSIDKGRKRHW